MKLEFAPGAADGNIRTRFGCYDRADKHEGPPIGETVESCRHNNDVRTTSIGEFLQGIGAKSGAIAIEDRAAAIAYAIHEAADEDIVLIAGKGHENYQLIGDQRLAFSDYDAALANVFARRSKSVRQQ